MQSKPTVAGTCSNAPDGLPKEAEALLREIRDKETLGRGLRPKASKDRALLKKRGLILSKPPNHNMGMRSISGHAHVWYTTAAGRELLDYLGADQEGTD